MENLASLPGTASWVQMGLRPGEDRWPEVYAGLDEVAARLHAEAAVGDFFFMHKPPGLRVRFETTVDGRERVEQALVAELGAVVEEIVPGVYEPEELLFGGSTSMPYVHRLFTVDSRAWLAFHRLPDPPPAWAFSLALVGRVLAGLHVAGWEDLDVWDRIARQGGRVLPPQMAGDRVARAGAAIRETWTTPARLSDAIAGPATTIAEEWGPRLQETAREWRTGYFTRPGALIGSREGAAFWTIFHWNRGRLSGGVQALVTAALADRSARP